MILKFWPRWPQKQPLNLSSLKIHPMDFILNYIFEIIGFHWSKWAIDCLLWKTFIHDFLSLSRVITREGWFGDSSCIWPQLGITAWSRCAWMFSFCRSYCRMWTFRNIWVILWSPTMTKFMSCHKSASLIYHLPLMLGTYCFQFYTIFIPEW